jgi:hypothetical protein
MAKKYRERNTTAGPVVNTSYTRAMFEATLGYDKPATEYQQLTASGTIELDKYHIRLNAAVGNFTVVLPDGTEEHEEQYIFNVGVGGSWLITGSFRGFTGLQFDTVGQSATLKWVASKWHMVGGNAIQV